MSRSGICTLCIHHLGIPLKRRVVHAASARAEADPIIVSIELYAGTIGYGETLPRPYVTGEDHASVERAIEEIFVPLLLELRPESFAEALEVIESLPLVAPDGRCVMAARAAVELALLDAYSRHFQRPIGAEAGNWLELSVLGGTGGLEAVRCSGVLSADSAAEVLRTLRRMRCYGLRAFKLKVGVANEDDLVQAAANSLGAGLRAGRSSLRLDANGGWSLDRALSCLQRWSGLGITHIEQPLAREDEENLQDLRAHTRWRLVHDESLITEADAERLVELGVADCFNIRISKCGGFLPAMKLVRFCRQHDVAYMLGCMVGQTSLLSAVERRFLEQVGGVRFVESNYGRFLLADDVTHKSLRFSYGGRLGVLGGPGWGVEVRPDKLEQLGRKPCLRLRL